MCVIFILLIIVQDIDEVLSLSPEKLLLQWMNYHLKRAGYKKTVNNFSSDVKVHTENSLVSSEYIFKSIDYLTSLA